MQPLLASLRSIPPRYPFAFGVGVSCVKTGAADALVQTVVERKEEFDYRRNAIFLLWGAVYLGGVQYFVYNTLFTRVLFPSAGKFVAKPFRQKLADTAGQVTVVKQVFLDQFVHHPFVLFPAFYTTKQFMEDGKFDGSTVPIALQKYAQNYQADLLACWTTWVPAFLVNFSICPLWARVPFVAVISFGFTAYMSATRGAPQLIQEEDARQGLAGAAHDGGSE